MVRMGGGSQVFVAALAFCVHAGPAAAHSENRSSHGPEFFRDLLAGQVWVGTMGPVGASGDARSVWFGPDGNTLRCPHGGDEARGSWGVGRDRRHRALLRGLLEGGARLPEGERGGAPVFYDRETGGLHVESWRGAGGAAGWRPAAVGHLQESWPRSLAERCPGVDLPAGLAVNESQTETAYEALRAQDPGAAVRRFRGSELRGPGAHGRGWVELERGPDDGGGTLSADELKDFLVRRDGEVLLHDDGSRHALVLREGGDELWRLARDDSITDVGHLTLAGDEIVLRYEESDREERWEADFALPVVPTGERYAAMVFADWLVWQPEPVVLPFHGVPRVGFRFARDGTAAASTVHGGEVEALWEWSGGDLILRVRGFERPAAYPWGRLAAHVGWPGVPVQ